MKTALLFELKTFNSRPRDRHHPNSGSLLRLPRPPTQVRQGWFLDAAFLHDAYRRRTFLRAPAEGLSEAEVKEKLADWQKAYAEIIGNKLTSTDESTRKKAFEDHRQLYEKRATIVREESTGFVWLYLQK